MTTTVAVAQPTTCTRCKGTGKEPDLLAEYTSPEQRGVIAQLVDAGERRAGSDRHKLAGHQALVQAYEDIRVHGAEARRLGITTAAMAKAVGVSRAQLYSIMTGKTGN